MMRDLLNKLKWNKQASFDKIKIFYESRGCPDDMGCIEGSEIINIGKYFLETEKGSIPYHRIRKIEQNGKILFLNRE